MRTVNVFIEAHPGELDLVEWALFEDDTLEVYNDALNKLQVSKIVGTPEFDTINRMLLDGLV